jgi:HIV Tat-specific factor 1
MPATDSARDLRNLVGDDVTADFESDPKFVDSNPTADASSENLAVLRDTDDEEDSDDELEDEDDDLDDEVDEDDEDLDDDDVEDDIEEDDEEQEEEEDEPDEELAARHSLKLFLRQAA